MAAFWWDVIHVLSWKSGRFPRLLPRILFYSTTNFSCTGEIQKFECFTLHSAVQSADLISMLTSHLQIKGEQSENCIRGTQRPVLGWRTVVIEAGCIFNSLSGYQQKPQCQIREWGTCLVKVVSPRPAGLAMVPVRSRELRNLSPLLSSPLSLTPHSSQTAHLVRLLLPGLAG